MLSLSSMAIIGIVVLLVFMALGLPISFAMIVVGVGGVAMILNWPAALQLLASSIWSEYTTYALTVIPLFILMGQLAYHSGVTERLYATARAWFGRMPGGVVGTTLATSAGFAAICGSNTATAATMSSVAMPEMRKYGYNLPFGASSIAVGATLGVVIPPSVVMIVLAVQTQQSVLALFLAGIVPGLIALGVMLIIGFAVCLLNPDMGPPGGRVSILTKIKSLNGIIEAVILFAIIIGGLIVGWFTPTEAGAAGSAAALVMGVARRSLGIKGIARALEETIRIAAMVLLLIAGAVLFGKFMILSRAPFMLAQWTTSLGIAPFAVLGIVLIIYAIAGALMDALGFLIVSLPVFFPLGLALGFDPIWYATLLCLVTTFGAISPPIGVNVFIVKSFSPEVTLFQIFKYAVMFSIAYLVCIVAVVYYPQLATALPGALG
jgi:tripartite ATP-independent transporter DctM subunit